MHLDQPCNREADNRQQSAHSPQYANNNNNNNKNHSNIDNIKNMDITNKKLLSETESVDTKRMDVDNCAFVGG